MQRSCVFDGVEDVPSNTGVSGAPAGKGSTAQRNGGRGQNASSRNAPSRGARNGGPGVAGAMMKSGSRSGYDGHNQPQQHHVVHANRRSVIIHGPTLSPSSGSAGSPPFIGSLGSDDGGVRRGGGGGHHAFHLHGTSPPPQLPPPLTSHQMHQQHYQHHHLKTERRTAWAVAKDEHSHLSRHHSHGGHPQNHSHLHHSRQSQPLFAAAATSQGSHPVVREDMDAVVAYDGRVRRATPSDVYGNGGPSGCRGEVGYTASVAHGVVSYASERPRGGGGNGMSGHVSPIPLGNEDYDYDSNLGHPGLVRWTSESGAYPMHSASSYNAVIRTGRTNGRGW